MATKTPEKTRRFAPVALLLVLFVAVTCCSRKPAKPQADKATQVPVERGHKTATKPTPANQANTSPSTQKATARQPSWPASVPVDILLQAAAPLMTPDTIDVAVRPLGTMLRERPDVAHVWSRASPGRARLLVRFGVGTNASDASKIVEAAWQEEPPAGFASPVVMAIARGARAVTAYSLLSDKGREHATRIADTVLVPEATELASATRVSVFGSIRNYSLLYVQPSTSC